MSSYMKTYQVHNRIRYETVFTSLRLPKAVGYVHSMHRDARWKAKSSSVMVRMVGLSCIKRLKLVPILIAPILSLFVTSIQSRCVQRRSPRIFFPRISSISFQGPLSPKQRQQVLLVYASGVGQTTNLLDSFLMRPTPMQGGLPRLQAAPALPAMSPHDP